MLNPIATVKSVGLHALLVGALALFVGAPLHEAQSLKNTSTSARSSYGTCGGCGTSGEAGPIRIGDNALVIRSGNGGMATATVKETHGGMVFLGAGYRVSPRLVAMPKWGFELRTGRGEGVFRLDPSGDVYWHGILIDHDRRVLRAFASWWATTGQDTPADNALLYISPGKGYPTDKRALDGQTVLNDGERHAVLRIDTSGLGHYDYDDGSYRAFVRWLSGAVPRAGLAPKISTL